MIPSLFTFTLLAAAAFLIAGLPLLLKPVAVGPLLQRFPRHRLTGLVTMILGGGWFLWKITQLGQSDFGDYKAILFILFAATLVGSILYVPDFLAVRGVAILVLLSANTGLKSAFGLYDIPERLVLVFLLYALIVPALYFGIMPFKMRDVLKWLCRDAMRIRAAGILFSGAGALLVVTSLLY